MSITFFTKQSYFRKHSAATHVANYCNFNKTQGYKSNHVANHCNFTTTLQAYRANHIANNCNFTQGYIAVVSTLLGKFRRTVLRRIVLYPYGYKHIIKFIKIVYRIT